MGALRAARRLTERLSVLLGRAPEEVVDAGGLVLRVRILHAGTRSEGREGRLYDGDREVSDPVPGTRVERAGTTFEFHGRDRPHL